MARRRPQDDDEYEDEEDERPRRRPVPARGSRRRQEEEDDEDEDLDEDEESEEREETEDEIESRERAEHFKNFKRLALGMKVSAFIFRVWASSWLGIVATVIVHFFLEFVIGPGIIAFATGTALLIFALAFWPAVPILGIVSSSMLLAPVRKPNIKTFGIWMIVSYGLFLASPVLMLIGALIIGMGFTAAGLRGAGIVAILFVVLCYMTLHVGNILMLLTYSRILRYFKDKRKIPVVGGLISYYIGVMVAAPFVLMGLSILLSRMGKFGTAVDFVLQIVLLLVTLVGLLNIRQMGHYISDKIVDSLRKDYPEEFLNE